MENVALPIVPQISDDLLERYALKMLRLREVQDDSPLLLVLNEIEKVAEDETIPIIGALEGTILATLISMLCPAGHDALDIGSAIGYSALWLAKVIGPSGRVTSIEIDPVRAKRAREFVRRAGADDRIEIITGDIFDTVPNQNKKYDVIFQDVMKHVYFAQDPTLAIKLLDICVAHLEIGGVLLTDNAFCQGKVLYPSEYNQVKGIQAYNEAIATHKQLDSILIPLRDGLWFSRKRA
jgi:caffeoyl-CoA O-methyltransferase